MIEKYSIRTDLALEEKERFESENVEVPGVVVREKYDKDRDIRVTTVIIETENAAKIMKRPTGCYVTLESSHMMESDEGYHREISECLAEELRKMIPAEIMMNSHSSILVAGLGNRKITPDALGPFVVDNLNITRHIIREYGKYAVDSRETKATSAIVPGVMAQTGMDAVEILQGIVRETSPDLLIAIDALAARNTKRLNRTIQIADTGIHPGSGVGNNRSEITEKMLGIPVIAIGVPTVVDAATIVNDTMENFIRAMETSEALKGVGVVLQGYQAEEKYELIKELISPHLNGLYVTPKDIDETVKRISFTLSEAINRMVLYE